MAEKYFEKFQTITYANTLAKDLTQRVVFTDNTLKNPYVFYPYDLDHYERPDQFSNRYYNDQYYTWLLYLSNEIVDPYYEWYQTEEEFNSFIEKKYGSVDTAKEKVKFYRTNWENDDVITLSAYAALPATVMHYWEPQYGATGSINSYVRKKSDIFMNTNNIRSYEANTGFISTLTIVSGGRSYSNNDEIVFVDGGNNASQATGTVSTDANGTIVTVTLTSNGSGYSVNPTIIMNSENGYGASFTTTLSNLILGEVCTIDFDGLNVGQGQILFSNGSYVYVHCTSGVTLTNTTVSIHGNSHIYGRESQVNVVFTSANSVANNMLPEEQVYYAAVSCYEYEREKNESHKSIRVLDDTYAKDIAKELKDLLK